MARLLMAAWDGAGAVPPLLSVARALVERGHDLRVIGDPVLRGDVQATGARHVSWTRAPHRKTRSRDSLFIEDWGPDGFSAMRDNLAVGPAREFADDVREELTREPADVLLTELLLFGPLVAAEATGVPAVVLNPTINIVPVDGVPPFGPGLLPATTEAERRQHEQISAHAVGAWDEALPALNAARSAHGLPPLEHVLDQGRAAARVLVMTSEAFDFTGPLPPVVKYVGPRLDDIRNAGSWQCPPGEDPLVLVALSSDFQDQEGVLTRIVEAVSGLAVRAVVTTGRGIDPRRLPAADNVQVMQFGPHQEILRHAAAVITHGGHGTTIKSLAAGVPLVCLPMGRDQLDIAARIEHRRVGIRLEAAADPQAVRQGLLQVLSDRTYRLRAEAVAEAIKRETAQDRAVAEIEAVVHSCVPV